jgi:hypothetical protein
MDIHKYGFEVVGRSPSAEHDALKTNASYLNSVLAGDFGIRAVELEKLNTQAIGKRRSGQIYDAYVELKHKKKRVRINAIALTAENHKSADDHVKVLVDLFYSNNGGPSFGRVLEIPDCMLSLRADPKAFKTELDSFISHVKSWIARKVL